MSQGFGASAKPRERAVPELPDPEFWARRPSRCVLIFLDFDGVLHPLGPASRRFERAPQLLAALRATERSLAPCSIALSTSWRFHPRERLAAELDRAAPGLSAFLEGRAGSRSEPGSPLGARGSQAAAYLAERPGPEPLAAICLDDQRSLFRAADQNAPSPRDWLLLCDPARGLPAARQLARALAERSQAGSELLAAAREARLGGQPDAPSGGSGPGAFR